jgi:hypothetical protein
MVFGTVGRSTLQLAVQHFHPPGGDCQRTDFLGVSAIYTCAALSLGDAGDSLFLPEFLVETRSTVTTPF